MRVPPLLLIVAALSSACGGDPSPTTSSDPDAADPGPDPDANLDPDPDPDPDPDAPPACLTLAADPTSCRECLGGPPLAASASACTATVCDLDPSCCDTLWDARCVKLADAACEVDRCVDAVAFTGWFNVTVGQWSPSAAPTASFASESWTSANDRIIASADWADHDGDGFADAVTAGDCFVRVLRGTGWSGDQLALAPIFSLDLGCGTDTVFNGHAARWLDADHDGDLDIVVSGVRGAFWIEAHSGAFVRAGDLVPPGSQDLIDLVVGDLDDDGAADVVVIGWKYLPDQEYPVQLLDRYEYDDGRGDFVLDPGWGEQLHAIGLSMMRACDVAGDRRRELVMAGAISLFGHNVFAGELGDPGFALAGAAGAFACANLDDDPRDEVVVNRDTPGGMAIQVVDDGVVVWSSATDLPAPLYLNAGGLEAADLDDDGDVDIAIGQADAGETPGVLHVLWNRPAAPAAPALAFDLQVLGDLHPVYDTGSAQALHLPPPPSSPLP